MVMQARNPWLARRLAFLLEFSENSHLIATAMHIASVKHMVWRRNLAYHYVDRKRILKAATARRRQQGDDVTTRRRPGSLRNSPEFLLFRVLLLRRYESSPTRLQWHKEGLSTDMT